MSNRSVKPIVAAVALLAIATFFLVGYLQHPRPSFAEGVQFIQALHKYAESREQRGQPRPASVEVRELVEGGLVSAKDARWFEGSKVTFTVITNLSGQQDPFNGQHPLIHVQLRDGRALVMSMDGSISMLPR